MTRDFLNADPALPGNLTDDEKARLQQTMQTNYLASIARLLRQQQANVLCSAVVKGTSQFSNAITDANSHEVVFQVGGKPVEIYKLLAFSTWTGTVALSVLSLSKTNDGIPLAAGDTLILDIPTSSVFISSATAASGTPLAINGPSDSTTGGFFLYGYTVPDWDEKYA